MFSVHVFTFSMVTQLFDFPPGDNSSNWSDNFYGATSLSDKRDWHRGILVHAMKGKGEVAGVAVLIGVYKIRVRVNIIPLECRWFVEENRK